MKRLFHLACLLIVTGCGHPTDDQLIAQLKQHRTELEKLVRMFRADKGLGRVGNNFTRPEDPKLVGVSEERIKEYRRLCSAVGAVDCIEGYDAAYNRLYGAVVDGETEEKDPIWIHVSSFGLAVSGSGKGFFYAVTPPKPPFVLVPDLDKSTISESGTWLRHIEGPWYLNFDN